MSATATSESETGLAEHVGLFEGPSGDKGGLDVDWLAPEATTVEPWCSTFVSHFGCSFVRLSWVPMPERNTDAAAAANGMGC